MINPVQNLVAKSLRADHLEKIVLSLAEADPTYCDDYLNMWCATCMADLPDTPGTWPAPSDHEAECPWRRAREYKEERDKHGT